MEYYKNKEYSRNYGFWNEDEQKCLSNAKVAIAGVGGDGFQLGYKLAMMGVRKFSIADPETFEPENSNRVFGAKTSTYGHNKAEVFRDMVLDIRPDAEIDIYTNGVNTDNIDDFINGATLILDESEITRLEIGTMIARAARKNNIPVLLVMNVGFSAIATSYHPSHGKTFEQVMGIPKNASLEEISKLKVDFSRCMPYIPMYGDISSLQAAKNGASIPSISNGVDVASAIGTTEAFLHITKSANNHRKQPTWAPNFRYMDSYNGKSGTIKVSRLSQSINLVIIYVRLLLRLNPIASYREQDRMLRNKQQ